MTSGPSVTYEFAEFRLDPAERLLLRDGHPVSLTPKAFELLVHLVEHAGKLADKSALMDALWPGVAVEEANLAFQVSALRRALDDAHRSEPLIQTIPTRGYRFSATVVRHGSEAVLHDRPRGAPPRWWTSPGFLGALAAVMLLVVIGAIWLGRRPVHGPARTTRDDAAVRVLPVTTLTGWQDWPAVSPDGEQVAFEWGGVHGDNHDVYVTLFGSRDVRRLTTDPAIDFAPSWSPNGREIAFLRAERGTARVHVMSALGGPDRVLSDLPAWSSIAWSPDSRFIVVGRVQPGSPERGLYAIPVSGGEPRPMVALREPAEAHSAAFSVDGRRLAYLQCRNIDQEGTAYFAEQLSQGCRVLVIDVDANTEVHGTPRPLFPDTMGGVGTPTWSRDGGSIVFWGRLMRPRETKLGASDEYLDRLWRVSTDGQYPPERIELAGVNARRATAAASRDRLVFSRSEEDVDIFRLTPGRPAERLVTSSFFDAHGQFSPDGRHVAFGSNRTGAFEIWIADADGSGERQLTRGPTLYQGSPAWSPDGSHIALDSQEANGDRHIWMIGIEGTGLRQLTAMPGDQAGPTWSPDGRWVYFSHDGTGRREIWRVPVGGGAAEQVSKTGSGVIGYALEDGQRILHKATSGDGPLMETNLDGGTARAIGPCVAGYWGFSVRGTSVYYEPCAPQPPGTIRVLDLLTGSDRVWGTIPDPVTTYRWNIPFSPDGNSILFDREVNLHASLWVLEGFR